jgi:hypothetical protein
MQLWYIHETVSMDAMTASVSKAEDNTADAATFRIEGESAGQAARIRHC